jgi:hypothetical protein
MGFQQLQYLLENGHIRMLGGTTQAIVEFSTRHENGPKDWIVKALASLVRIRWISSYTCYWHRKESHGIETLVDIDFHTAYCCHRSKFIHRRFR